MLDLLDARGRVLGRATHPEAAGDDLASEQAVSKVLAGAPWMVTTEAVEASAFRRESEALAERARVEVPDSATAEVTTLQDGLVIEAAAPVLGEDGARIGIAYGWKLLNHDSTIVDQIKQILYQGETWHGRAVGEGTLCLGDVRIATNAVVQERRAIGSRVDPVVRRRVLEEGLPRIDRTDVLGEAHLTAYDPCGTRAARWSGFCAWAFPKGAIRSWGKGALSVFVVLSTLALGLGFVVAGVIARGITRPIAHLVSTTDALARGDLDARWQSDKRVGEIEVLGARFNQMADSIRDRDRDLRHRTQEQVGRAERLAMIGRLAAGVVHEINNPLGGIMLFSNQLLRKAPETGQQRDNLVRITNEAKRCQRIPQGEHTIHVCLGTACHVRKGPELASSIDAVLGIKAGETDQEQRFTLEQVHCLGCCALAPVMKVDDKYYGNPSLEDLKGIFAICGRKEQKP